MSRLRLAWKSLPVLVLVVAGIASTAYLLVMQRFPVPFQKTYEVRAVLPAADGVAPGFGQAVNVAGVRVGSITKAKIENRQAVVTLEINRDKLPRVHRDARADLRPVTPLDDMRIELDPGTRGTPDMPDDGIIPPSHTTSPVPLATLLNSLDTDTRGFLATLVNGLGEGTRDRAPDLRRVLLSFGPTTEQLRQVTASLAARRVALSRLVTNVAAVTRAANSDGRLGSLVVAGNKTLNALARQDEPLRQALKEFPGAAATADDALRTTGRLGGELKPALEELTPPVRRLPGTLRTLEPSADAFTKTIRTQFLPFTKEAQPVLRAAGPTLRAVSGTLPDTTRVVNRANLLLNGLTYNPPGPQEGGLFWFFWQGHNFNSSTTQGDAHGNNVRALVSVTCNQLTTTDGSLSTVFKILTGAASVCPATDNPSARGATARKTDAAAKASAKATGRLVPVTPEGGR